MELAMNANLSSAGDPTTTTVILVSSVGTVQLAFRLSPEEAKTFAEGLLKAARDVESGLEIIDGAGAGAALERLGRPVQHNSGATHAGPGR